MLEMVRITLMRNEVFFMVGTCLAVVLFGLIRTCQMHAINKKMKIMMRKIQQYMDSIVLEDEQTEKREEKEEIVRYIERELEKGKQPEEKQKISEEDEKLFDHVIREYFS